MDDIEAQNLFQKRLLEPGEAPHIMLKEAPQQETARRNLMKERATTWPAPIVDHRFDGVPQAIIDVGQPRSLTKQVLPHPKKAALMQELFLEDGKSFTPMSEHAKTVIVDHFSVEAFELLKITDKVQCAHCHQHVTSGHVY